VSKKQRSVSASAEAASETAEGVKAADGGWIPGKVKVIDRKSTEKAATGATKRKSTDKAR